MDETYFMAIDPGKTTGYATWDEQGVPNGFGHVRSAAELSTELQRHGPKVVIVENFRLRPWLSTQQSWSDFPASRVIGMVEMYCELAGAALVKQEPSCKETGYAWSGVKKAKDHKDSHYRDAYAHGVFYLVKNKIRTVASYLEQEQEA